MARATRVMTESSPKEEGDDGHKNQLDTKAVATARTVVASNGRRCKIDSNSNHNEERGQDCDGRRQW